MGVLEIIVIATIVLAGSYVGYHAWQDSLNADEEATLHLVDSETRYRDPLITQIPPHFSIMSSLS